MRSFALASLLISLTLTLGGCSGGTEVVTDPTKLTPLTEEQKKEARKLDEQVAADEHGTPVQAKKPAGKRK